MSGGRGGRSLVQKKWGSQVLGVLLLVGHGSLRNPKIFFFFFFKYFLIFFAKNGV